MSSRGFAQFGYKVLGILFGGLAETVRALLRTTVWAFRGVVQLEERRKMSVQRSRTWIDRNRMMLRNIWRQVIGWTLIGLGLLGIVLPVLPGILFLVIGSEVLGFRHPWIDRLAEPLYAAGDRIPLERVPARLRPMLSQLRKKEYRDSSESARPNE